MIRMPFTTLAALFVASLAEGQVQIPATPLQPAAVRPQAESRPVTPLAIGDRAPAFEIAEWVKGSPVKAFEPGKAYVMEFWATWCGPCRTSMPHISELQGQYGDRVTFIGVSDEKLDTVKGFLDQPEWAAKTQYTLATDPDRSTHDSYMKAASQQGIPTAFLVGQDGTVQWIGHPMNIDGPLAEVVAGTWDAAAFKKQFDAEIASEKLRRETMGKVRTAMQKGDWDGVIAVYDEVLAKNPDDLQALMSKAQVLLTKAKRPADGYAIAKSIVEKNASNPMILNALAWMVVDNPEITERDLGFATSTARAAVEASGGKDGSILDTLARCLWESGDRAGAIETQRKAVELAPEGPMGDEMKETLKRYEGDPKG
jgi:thiol-disulfide isomerase/thioredoxin